MKAGELMDEYEQARRQGVDLERAVHVDSQPERKCHYCGKSAWSRGRSVLQGNEMVADRKALCASTLRSLVTLQDGVRTIGHIYGVSLRSNHVHKALKVEFFIMQIKIHITWLLFSATQCQDPLYINLTNGTTTTAPSI